MIPMSSVAFPVCHESLLAGVRGGLAQVFRLPRQGVLSFHGDFPSYDELRIDLSGAEMVRLGTAGDTLGSGNTQPGITAHRFSIVGRPIRSNGARVDFDLTGERAQFDFDRCVRGRPVLVPVLARGQLRLHVPQASLQSLLLDGVREIAARQSITVEKTHLMLTQLGERSLRAAVRVEATKMAGFIPVKGTLVVTGRLDIDQELTATLSELSVKGEGVVGSLIAPLVQRKLDACHGKSVSLANLPLGNLAFHELHVDVGSDALAVEAIIGSPQLS